MAVKIVTASADALLAAPGRWGRIAARFSMEFHLSKARKPDASSPGGKADEERKKRLAAQLRANLARRKAQARSRRQGEADQRPDGLGPDATDTDK